MATNIITTGSWPKFLWEGIKGTFGSGWERYEKQWTYLLDEVSSQKAWEEYVQKPGFGPATRKYEGQAVTYDGQSQGFVTRISNLTYGLGYIITREAFDDQLYGEVASALTPELLYSMAYTQEIVAANVYNNVTNATYVGSDNATLLSTSHNNFNGGTYANKPATDVDLSEAALEDMVILIRQMQDDRQLPVLLRPKCLIVHPQNEFEAQRILKSQYTSSSANNAINVLGMGNYVPEIYVNIYLTAKQTWFLRTNVPVGKGLIFQQRRAPEITRDNEYDTENYKVKATMRFGVGWNDPRALTGSVGP